MKKQDKKMILFGAVAVGALLLLTNKSNAAPPTCPPGYFWNGATCVKIPTQTTGGNTGGGGGGGGSWFNSLFNSLPGIIDSTGNLVNAIQNNPPASSAAGRVGYMYAMRY